MLRQYGIIVALLCVLGVEAQEEMTYYLPRTFFRFEVTVEKTRYEPGLYAGYAEKYFKLDNARQKVSTKSRILNMKIEQLPERDTTKCYTLKVDAKQNMNTVRVSDQGCLLAVNSDADVVTVSAPQAHSTMTTVRQHKPVPYTEEMLQATSKARVAKLVASEIYSIRDDRRSLISGGENGEAVEASRLKVMLGELAEREALFTELFVGTTVVDTLTEIYDYMPEGAVQGHKLFSVGNTPYYIDIEVLSRGEGIAVADISKKNADVGVFVNVPGVARLSVYKDKTLWTQFNYYMPQFGNTERLMTELFSKKVMTTLKLNPVTGAIKSIDTTPLK